MDITYYLTWWNYPRLTVVVLGATADSRIVIKAYLSLILIRTGSATSLYNACPQ